MRAEFRIWHEGDIANYVMYSQSNHSQSKKPQRITINEFPVASRIISTTMPKLMSSINNNPVLRKKLYQIEFLSTLSGQLLITLIYHRALTQDWIDAAKQLTVAR